jgi:ABC-2 type transport system permease protein
MSTKPTHTTAISLNIVWAIASKDIVDAVKNRVVISMIIMLSIMLLVPKLLPYIFEQTQTVVPVYNVADASLMADLKNSTDLSIQNVHSLQELKLALCNAIYPEIGLLIPAGVKPAIDAGAKVDLQGFVCWDKRHQVSDLQLKLEMLFSQLLGVPVNIDVEGNIIYPPTEGVLYLNLVTINSIVLILMIGIFTVPSLLIEEKEAKTMQALLVSPANIIQVVAGKALAGSFYVVLSGILIFLITWTDVVHWAMAILFIIASGIFSVAVGLVLGCIFDKQQDMAGWITAVLLILVGAVLIKALGVELPALVRNILPWVPSVALAEIYHAALYKAFSPANIWTDFGVVCAFSLILYILVIIRLRRIDH